MTTNTKSTTASMSTKPQRPVNARIVQNFHLVWLDGSIDENNDDCCNSITTLRQVVNTVNTFIDVDQCIDFITDIKETAFMVISGQHSQTIIPIVEDIPQVTCIYIFGENNLRYESSPKIYIKLKGVFIDIISICEALKQVVKVCDRNSTSISFIKPSEGSSKQNLDQLDPSFMYTQILKEILLTIDFERVHFNEFITYCREQFFGNNAELKNVDLIEKEYRPNRSIWWYTSPYFLYSMLNKALRSMDVPLLVNMGFFVRDLHNNITALHTEQYSRKNHSDSFIVYRGQVLTLTEFDCMKQTQGGLMSFNNFLSTSLNREVSLVFAEVNTEDPDSIGVLFEIKIDPSISSFSFADVKNVSHFQDEEEILFSMHSVFRIEQVKQIENNTRLWQVELTLTGDNDPYLHRLTESMREETAGSTGWYRLGQLMINVAQYTKAEELYEQLLKQATNEDEKAHIFHMLGTIKIYEGKYAEAAEFHGKDLEISQKTLPANHPNLAASYSNIGRVYDNIGEYSKALSYYEKALEILQKSLPANHPDLATCYNNIGLVYSNIGEYSKALSYYEKALEISQKTLPANHPDLATSYNNIGGVYDDRGEYSKALSYYEKALEISQKTLPVNHPSLATCYNSIGLVYSNMGEYSKALSYYEKALEILQKSLPANHPKFASSYNNIGLMFSNIDEYSKALLYYEKALEIEQKTLPPNHPNLATSYNNIGMVYDNIDEYSKALSYYEKALEMSQKTLPANHPDLATSYSNTGGVYYHMGEYSKALSYCEKALEISQKTLPANHPNLASSYHNIGMAYYSIGEYSKALSCVECASYIWGRSLPPSHPHLKIVKDSIEIVKKKL